MTISLKHAFTSAKGDPADTTLVRPSNWNAEHTLTLATDKLIGRSSSGTGAAEEISCGSFGRSILACASASALQAVFGIFTTGDVKLTLKTSADTGWVMMNDGTIGDASSSATTRANADTSDLFTLLWTNFSNSLAPVSGGRGASAAADFAAHKTIGLTKVLGRALAISGAGSGLTSRTLGDTVGGETQTLIEANLPPHAHAQTAQQPTLAYSTATIEKGTGSNGTQTAVTTAGSGGQTATCGDDGTPGNTGNGSGSSTAFSIMQPTTFLNVMVKL